MVIIILLFLVIYDIHTISKNIVSYDTYCLVFNDINNKKLTEHIQSEMPLYVKEEGYSIHVDTAYPFSYLEEQGLSWPDEASFVKIASLVGNKKADIAITDYPTMLSRQTHE